MTNLHSRRSLREIWPLGKGKCLLVALGISVLSALGSSAIHAGQTGAAPVQVAQAVADPDARQQALTKLQDLQVKLEAWVQQGGDHAKVAPFGQEINKHMVAGEYAEAEKVMDQALSLMGAADEVPAEAGQEVPETLAREPSGVEATNRGEPVRTSAPDAFIGIAYNTHAKSPKGDAGWIETMDLMRDSGMNAVYAQSPWDKIEASPGNIGPGGIAPVLTRFMGPYPEFERVLFIFKVVDTNVRVMPADLADKDFDDPVVLQRLDSIVDAIARQPYSRRVTHVMLGNEVDAYLAHHSGELAAFSTFYQRFIDRVRQKLPNVKVGAITTFNGSQRFPHIFNELVQYSDFVDFSYYPVRGLVGGNRSAYWNMRPVSEVARDIAHMAGLANGKPFGFTEIGYTASAENQSSEKVQAAFVREMFRVLDPYRAKGQIEFLLFHMLYDPADRSIQHYAQRQGVTSAGFTGFMSHLGLRAWSNGAPREAWAPFVEGAMSWTSGAPLPADWWRE